MTVLAPYMRGWRNYFGFCETPEVLIGLTRWVRLRLRAAMCSARPRSATHAYGHCEMCGISRVISVS
jgi:hypothetical protein